MGCTNLPQSDDLHCDMSWWIGRNSGLIQLKQLLPLEVLYPESHGAGEVGALWEAHHAAFAKFLNRFTPTAVFEIGGAHGILEKNYQQYKEIPWTILEPNPAPVAGCKANFIKGFFDNQFIYSEEFDTVVHSHVLEHIYDPLQFMQYLADFISVGKKLIFSVPNMQVWLDRKYTNCINFEHTLFLTEPYIEYLLAKFGFEIHEKEYFKDDHSIFYATERCNRIYSKIISPDLYQTNKNLYKKYSDYYKYLIIELNTKISNIDQPIYLFGAHIFSQYLLAFGLNSTNIYCLLDNDKNKHGKRLYGTNLNVASPKILTNVDKPHVILKAGMYNDEIKHDILANINAATLFLE